MKNIFKVLAITFAALIGFSFFACGGVDDGTSGTGTAPAITTASLPSGTVGTPYSQTLAATGTTPITWSVESGALPAGLDIAATGVISGTPTTADTFTFTVKAANAAGNGTKQLSITIANAGTTFVAVTSITDVPTTVVTNEELTLTGTVNPSNATNKTIAWTIKDQGGTSSTLTENILTAANSGTVKVTATITNGLTETSNYMQDFDITITQFTGTTYTVTFKNWDNETLKTQTVNEGSHATAPGNPTREGYTFTGWDKTFTNVTSDLTVTAQFTINTYTITYVNADGLTTNTTTYPTTYTIETNTITFPTVTKTGYTFNGWEPASITKGSTGDKTITAQWTANQYTITYKDVGDTAFSGTNSSSLPTTHTYGTATTLVRPTKANNVFGGWFTNGGGTGSAIYSLSATGYTGNITLYAKWYSGDVYWVGEYYGSGARRRPSDGTFQSASYGYELVINDFKDAFDNFISTGNNIITGTAGQPYTELYGKGYFASLNGPTSGNPSSITLSGIGYLFIISSKEIKVMTVGGLSMMTAFTLHNLDIDGKGYFLYRLTTPLSSESSYAISISY